MCLSAVDLPTTFLHLNSYRLLLLMWIFLPSLLIIVCLSLPGAVLRSDVAGSTTGRVLGLRSDAKF